MTAATGRVKSRLLSRTVESATSALIAAGFGLVFFDVLTDAGCAVPRRLRGASVSGASAVAGVVATFTASFGFRGRG